MIFSSITGDHMVRRLLTKNQTRIIDFLRDELTRRTQHETSFTDILDSCVSEPVIALMVEKLTKDNVKRDRNRELELNRKGNKVYHGIVQANGLAYRAIVAVRDKAELKRLLDMNTSQLNTWKMTDNAVHVDVAITQPRKFFICPNNKKGRPSRDSYSVVDNPKPVNAQVIK